MHSSSHDVAREPSYPVESVKKLRPLFSTLPFHLSYVTTLAASHLRLKARKQFDADGGIVRGKNVGNKDLRKKYKMRKKKARWRRDRNGDTNNVEAPRSGLIGWSCTVTLCEPNNAKGADNAKATIDPTLCTHLYFHLSLLDRSIIPFRHCLHELFSLFSETFSR